MRLAALAMLPLLALMYELSQTVARFNDVPWKMAKDLLSQAVWDME